MDYVSLARCCVSLSRVLACKIFPWKFKYILVFFINIGLNVEINLLAIGLFMLTWCVVDMLVNNWVLNKEHFSNCSSNQGTYNVWACSVVVNGKCYDLLNVTDCNCHHHQNVLWSCSSKAKWRITSNDTVKVKVIKHIVWINFNRQGANECKICDNLPADTLTLFKFTGGQFYVTGRATAEEMSAIWVMVLETKNLPEGVDCRRL